MICLKSPGFDTLVDPLDIQNDLAFLTDILAVEALTTFAMRVNCDRGEPLFQCWDGRRTKETDRGYMGHRYSSVRPRPHDSGIKKETGTVRPELEYMHSQF